MSNATPEGLYLSIFHGQAGIFDAQECVHIMFDTYPGDPCEWSAGIVTATCKALGIDRAHCDVWETEELGQSGIDNAIAYWHETVGDGEGFIK